MIKVEEVFGIRYQDACMAKLMFSKENHIKIDRWLHTEPKEKYLLFVHGTPGTGKTYFVAAMINFINDLNQKVIYRYYTDYELIAHLKNVMKEGWETVKEVIRLSDSADLFILDDLGSIRMTEWEHEQIHALVDHRYRFKKPTIIVSNLNRNDINEKFEARFISRIFGAENTIVEIICDDLRKIGY